MKKTIQNISDVAVGEMYSVPCIKTDIGILPVLLPPHSDGNENCLREVMEHYHIDFRFCELMDSNGFNAWYIQHASEPFMMDMFSIRSSCNSFDIVGESAFFFVNRWYKRKIESELTNRRCPHQGTLVVNSCGTCPAHGLEWDLKTSKLADYKLPFYLELANRGVHLDSNSKGVVEDKSCKIVATKDYSDFDGTVIMVDSNGKKYSNMKQIIKSKPTVGDVISFTTKKLCD